MGANQYSKPVTDQDRADICRLHAEGCGRNEIARQLVRSPRTISVEAAKMGLTFDRAATEEATRARKADLEEKRVILADALTDDALRLSAQVWEPATIYNFGGKDNTYEFKLVDEPPAIDKKALITAATAASAQSLRLVPPTVESGSDDARSMLGKLFTGLAEVVREHEAAEPEEAEGESP
ncbi:helix-turn-helix domain-containing protein [Streptomyces sp.]|uniref:helix-turn-helix domain-containing protein n=1 Tax=Streptomyces sp. TaxID=1931 RepID=UPI002D77F16A|nr:helix-turn-helix domain-containing protein [Streptomyces sp.]HET6356082.1 helix-turn-helix domain-containing protein [Streptomyces sp.]